MAMDGFLAHMLILIERLPRKVILDDCLDHITILLAHMTIHTEYLAHMNQHLRHMAIPREHLSQAMAHELQF